VKTSVFAIWDDKAKAYMQPFFLPTVGMATRTVGDCVNDPKHNFGMHPEDYTLFRIGTFEDDTGSLTVLEPRETICSCVQLKRKES